MGWIVSVVLLIVCLRYRTSAREWQGICSRAVVAQRQADNRAELASDALIEAQEQAAAWRARCFRAQKNNFEQLARMAASGEKCN